MTTLRTILLFLLLGAAVNVGVAWGFALSRDIILRFADAPKARVVHHGRWSWLSSEWSESGSAVIGGMGSPASRDDADQQFWPGMYNGAEFEFITTEALPNWSGLRHVPHAVKPAAMAIRANVAHGWPLLALSCQMNSAFSLDWADTTQIEGAIQFGAYARGGLFAERVLPCRPIWPGFVTNTAFYAAALWLLFLGSGTVRRSIRRHRGRCVACGYDLRGTAHERCPECGNALKTGATA